MKRLFSCLLLLAITIYVTAQINVSGTILDNDTNTPLKGASVIIKDHNGKIKKYTTSNENGNFTISSVSTHKYKLEVTMMGYAKKNIHLDNISSPIIIKLEPGSTLLNEVTVKADRIHQEGDTITYNVALFSQKQDRSINDVLKRMPGIDVSETGNIKYQGSDINKFYIEGLDMLGGKYGIATNSINHDDVRAVEVMENHQPLQVLSGFSFSNKAAINLKLKDKAKANLTYHGNLTGGYCWNPNIGLWNGNLFAMMILPNFQSITTLQSNNTGNDLSTQVTDFLSSFRGTGLSSYINVTLPGTPALNRKRTMFNRSALVSTNGLWKLGKSEIKAQIDYSYNRVNSQAKNITTYFLDENNRIITENMNGFDRSHNLAGKIVYESNQKTAFINNTLNTDIAWNDVIFNVSGSNFNKQTANLPNYYICNDFKLIKRFNKKHLVTFYSKNDWESMPQALSVSTENNFIRQSISDHAYHTHESVAYAFSIKNVTISLDGGIKGHYRTLNSHLNNITNIIPKNISVNNLKIEDLINVVNTNYFTLYASPNLEYWVKYVNFKLNLPINFTQYTFNNALANRSEVYFSPYFSINWNPNNRFNFSLAGSLGRSPINLSQIQQEVIMTGYRLFSLGTDNFYNSSTKDISAAFNYSNVKKGLFANAFISQTWAKKPYTMVQNLFGDYAVYSYTKANSSSRAFTVNANIGKTLDIIRGNTNIKGSFMRIESNLFSEKTRVKSITTSWKIGADISGAPFNWLNIDYNFNFSSSRLAMNNIKNSWLYSMENKILLNIIPHQKWQFHISAEHYRNELSDNKFKSVFLIDSKLIFKANKIIEISASITNILNRQTYNYITYNQLNSFESQRWLRGRELLISIYLKK